MVNSMASVVIVKSTQSLANNKQKGKQMKLLTKEITEKATKQYDEGSDMEQMVVAKFFNPIGNGTWYLMNMDKDEDYCWGIVDMFAIEMGSFSMRELQSIQLPLNMGIERDKYFEPIKASELWKELNA